MWQSSHAQFFFHFTLSALVHTITCYHQIMDVFESGTQFELWQSINTVYQNILRSAPYKYKHTSGLSFPLSSFSVDSFLSLCLHLVYFWVRCFTVTPWLGVSDVSVCGFWMFAPVIVWKEASIALSLLTPSLFCLSVCLCLSFSLTTIQKLLLHWKLL